MLSNFCRDLAVQYVKAIVDRCRCDLCDRVDGGRLRFPCEHSACVDCVAVEGDCPTCSPFMDSSSNEPLSDEPQTEQVKHASELLTSFQDTFQIDVYQRQRISERLKIEKELFPECIQAPSKYFNKRKSLNVSKKGKENRISSFFLGEEISSSRESTMNKSRNYVQAWLNKQDNTGSPARSPFTDLKVNTYSKQATTRPSAVNGKQKHNELYTPTRQSNRKRSQVKQPLSMSTPQSSLEHYLKPVDKGSIRNAWMKTKSLKRKLNSEPVTRTGSKRHCDESGIVIDDESFTIEDTPDQKIDKDRLALLEVEKADNETSQSVVVIEDSQVRQAVNTEKASTSIDNVEVFDNKVPYYYKSRLYKTCNQCIDKDMVNEMKPGSNNDCKRNCDVSITVENKSFITTIQVVDCKRRNYDKKQSIAVQTDEQEPFLGFKEPVQKDETVTLISKMQDYIHSEAMFSEDKVAVSDSQEVPCTNIPTIHREDSSNNHHNKHGYGILTEIDGAGIQNMRRKPARGVTPDSNNSSDKENFDPNRMKKNGGKKKKKSHKF